MWMPPAATTPAASLPHVVEATTAVQRAGPSFAGQHVHRDGVPYGSRCVFKRPSTAVTSFVSRASGSPLASFLRRPIAASRGASFERRVTFEPETATYSKTRTARTSRNTSGDVTTAGGVAKIL